MVVGVVRVLGTRAQDQREERNTGDKGQCLATWSGAGGVGGECRCIHQSLSNFRSGST